MNDHSISQFIDNELSLDEKIVFVDRIHADRSFGAETVALLRHELLIRSEVADHTPAVRLPKLKPKRHFRRVSFGALAAGLAAVAMLLIVLTAAEGPATARYRFVLFQPEANRVEIAGSFTGWQTVPLKRIGAGSYWEATLELTPGEHRFSYILDGRQRIPDPTILFREKDDFGGENSIIEVGNMT